MAHTKAVNKVRKIQRKIKRESIITQRYDAFKDILQSILKKKKKNEKRKK